MSWRPLRRSWRSCRLSSARTRARASTPVTAAPWPNFSHLNRKLLGQSFEHLFSCDPGQSTAKSATPCGGIYLLPQLHHAGEKLSEEPRVATGSVMATVVPVPGEWGPCTHWASALRSLLTGNEIVKGKIQGFFTEPIEADASLTPAAMLQPENVSIIYSLLCGIFGDKKTNCQTLGISLQR